MNNSSLMLTAIEQGDWTDAAIKAALDALQEDYGHDLRRSVLVVARFLEDAANAAMLKLSDKRFSGDEAGTPLVYALVNIEVGLPRWARPKVKLVTGDVSPTLALPPRIKGANTVAINIVEVGVGWLLKQLAVPTPSPSALLD